jgi:xylulokinase
MISKSQGYLMGIDIGTYSSKGVLVDAQTGDIADSHIIEHGISNPEPGWAEHDADRVWWNEFVQISRHLLSSTKIHPEEIKSIGTSGLGACVLPVDEAGKPLRQAILYGIDTRAIEEMAELEHVFGKEKIFLTSLMNLSTQSTGPKILWIKNHERHIYDQTRCFLTSEAYLVNRLTGKNTLDYLTAADFAPMFDVRKRTWNVETTQYITSLAKLPDLSWSCKLCGKITREAARETGLMVDTPVIVGTTDSASEALSAGVSNTGEMVMMFGSSFYFILITGKNTPLDLFWSSAWLEEGAYVLQGGTSTSGSLTRWFRDNLAPLEIEAQNTGGENAYASLAKLLDQSPRGANGLIALPYFEGERTPVYDPQARGVLFGLTLKNTRADIYRALLEGVGFGIRHILDEMRIAGVYPSRMIGAGGGTQNLGWMQIISDIANIEMVIPEKQIGACYGDAFMAGVGIGLFNNPNEITRWVKMKYHLKPDPNASKLYEKFYMIFRDLYKNTAPLMHNLTSLHRVGYNN